MGLKFGKGPQLPETAKIREQIQSGELDLGSEFPEVMEKSLNAVQTTTQEWSDKWGKDGEIEVTRYQRSDDPVAYSIRGYGSGAADIRQAAAWLTTLADSLPE